MVFRSPSCAFLALLGAAAQAAAPVAKPLVFCAGASPEGFDPSLWDSASTSNVTSQTLQGLAGFVRGGTPLEALLATSWQISPDAKTFTFALRRGVKFHATPLLLGEQEWRQVLQRRIRPPDRPRPHRRRCRTAQPALPRGASDLQARAAVKHDGALVGLHPDPPRHAGICHVAQRQRGLRRRVARMSAPGCSKRECFSSAGRRAAPRALT